MRLITSSRRCAISCSLNCFSFGTFVMVDDNSELLDVAFPDPIALQTLALINIAWARVDAISSAALCSQLSIDPLEFSIMLGRTRQFQSRN